jgi:hypothetical protein
VQARACARPARQESAADSESAPPGFLVATPSFNASKASWMQSGRSA